jgi:hypothetical protein
MFISPLVFIRYLCMLLFANTNSCYPITVLTHIKEIHSEQGFGQMIQSRLLVRTLGTGIFCDVG